MPPPAKKARHGSEEVHSQARHDLQTGAVEPSTRQEPVPDLLTMIHDLDEHSVRKALGAVAQMTPNGYDTVRRWYDKHLHRQQKQRDREKARVVDLSHYSGDAWYVLNKKYKSSRGSVEYDRAFDAKEEVVDYIVAIEEEAHSGTSYGTKKSGLETLRKIGKSILLAPSTLGSEVIIQMESDPALTEAMIHILESMSLEERLRIAKSSDGKGHFYDKVAQLANEAEGYGLFEELDHVLKLLAGEEDEDDEEGEDEDEDEDESEDEDDDETR